MPQNSETSRPRLRRPAHPRFQCQTAEGCSRVHGSAFSRPPCPSFAKRCPSKTEGAGKAGCQLAPAVRVHKK
jgi:hypothetical protein